MVTMTFIFYLQLFTGTFKFQFFIKIRFRVSKQEKKKFNK